jgi:general secretion pathway protein A
MYAAWFGLAEPPFAITPDPRYLYLSARHSEALAHLLYGITEAGGFLQLTGEVGTGKTTLVRTLLERLPADVEVALVLNPRQSPREFVRTICDELRIAVPPQASLKDHVDALNQHLLAAHAAGRRTVVIVDEAQALPTDVLEQLRLLTNLETATHKLLQIVLVGQPELRETLARSELRQLAQRITARWHLQPLDPGETAAYVAYRLGVAGAVGPLFEPATLRVVHRLTGGVPRLINVLCDRALLGAYALERRVVDAAIVQRAAREVLGEVTPPAPAAPRFGALTGAAIGATLALTAAAALWLARSAPQPAPVRPAPVASVAPPTTPPQPPIGARLAALPADTDTAFATLFASWHIDYAPGPEGSACQQAAAAGLRCHYLRGSWNALRLLDRPAIVTLEDRGGAPRHLVVRALDASTATLAAGARTLQVPIAELDPLWFGEALALWQLPPHGDAMLRPGDRGPAVAWLRGQLALLRETDPALATSDEYDAELYGWVREFQTSRRAKVDGFAGEQTFVQLDAALPAPGTPTLAGVAGR